MPRKKQKTKGAIKTEPSIKSSPLIEYELITLEESHAHQIRHENLIQRIRSTMHLVEDVEVFIKEKHNHENIAEEWQRYLGCDKIPNPFEPQRIRNFFDKTMHFEKEDVENTINWLFTVDEMSILNQDIDSVDMSKRKLKKERVDHFGQQYEDRICETLKLSRRMGMFLKNPENRVSERILKDVQQLQLYAQKKIDDYMDNLTYRILNSEAAYMEPLDATTAEYSFQGKHFGIHIWTFQNVPLDLNPEDTPTKVIELPQIKTVLVIPFSVLSENMVIRGLQCSFDHLSTHARYYEMSISDGADRSLKKVLQKEWEIQKKIQAEVRTNMIRARADFEEAMRLKAEEEELKAKEEAKKQETTKKATPKKIRATPTTQSKEPPIVSSNQVPLVRKDFLDYDLLEYEKSIRKFHPEITLGLLKGEVNLRKFQILGDIYKINSIAKPRSTHLPKLIMTWYKAGRSMEYQHFHDQTDISRTDNISQFFEITFELPESLCYWGETVPCIFEELESEPDERFEISKNLPIISPVIINDFNLHELFTKSRMYEFIENSIPRSISSFKFPQELYDEKNENKEQTTLGHKKETAEDEQKLKQLDMQRQLLSFDVQNAPERLFPLFKNVLPIVILPMKEENKKEEQHPYEHFSDFMSAIERIKNSYRKSSFIDKFGNPVKILAEEYEKNIRRQRNNAIASRVVAYKKGGGRRSTGRASLVSGSHTFGTRKVSIDHTASRKSIEKLPMQEPSSNKEPLIAIQKKNEHDIKDGHTGRIKEQQKVFGKWSTVNVLKSEFNRSERKVTIWTDRLGTIGFAFNRYQHFPFKNWSLQPCKERVHELELQIETTFALFKIFVTTEGYNAIVTDFSKNPKKQKVFFELKEPVKEIRTLKEKLQQNFLNIFPEPDAVWYVNGNFTEKHLAAELHTYTCISLNASSLKFLSSEWNKKSNRRTIVLKVGTLQDAYEDFLLVKVTPEDVMFVDIKEINKELDTTELEYTPTWRNLEWYSDLNHLITSNYGDSFKSKNKALIFYLKNLLEAIRPLSFC